MSWLFGPAVEEAEVETTAAAVQAGEGILVDVREPHEWRAGRAAPAQHIPLGELPARLHELPRETPVYLICATGNRSRTAARLLGRAGFARAVNVRGGTAAWARKGLPIIR